MAFIGLRHPVVAKVQSHTKGQEPTYTAGMVIGEAIQADLAITRNNNPLYGDDHVVEDDNSITAMQLTLGITDIPEDVQAYVGLLKEVTEGTGTDAVTTYLETGGSPHECGLGYIRVRRMNGATTFQGIWIYRLVLGKDSESGATKNESITWQTPTVVGRCMATQVDNGDDPTFRAIRNFTTEAAALTWLNTKAGITGTTPAVTNP